MSFKLLLAEDSQAIQQVVQLAFEGEGVDVVVVDDGNAAIAALETESPDIVLADASLPGTDGYDLAARIEREAAGSSLPVVLLAGAFEPVDRNRANAAGCRDVLVKPFVPGDLVTRVMTLLDPAYLPRSPEPADEEDVPSESAVTDGAPAEAEPPEAVSVDGERTDPEPVVETPQTTFEVSQPEPLYIEPLPEPEPVSVVSTPEPIVVTPEPEPVEVAQPPEPTSLAHRPILAQAFATFLAAERELPPRSDVAVTSIAGPATLPSDLGDSVKRELTRRVRRRLTKDFVRKLADQVVAKAVDRIVREELARMNVRSPASK